MSRLVVSLVLLLVGVWPTVSALAQLRALSGGGVGGDQLLLRKSVQVELKLDDRQKKTLADILRNQKEYRRKGTAALQRGDAKTGMQLLNKEVEETTKALKAFKKDLTDGQRRRFGEIDVQVSTQHTDANVFRRADVQKTLELTDKQKENLKETLDDLDQTTRKLLQGASGTVRGREAFQKALTLRRRAYDKLTRAFTTEQARTWKEMGGKKFKLGAN
jgi:hypothetical protein